MASFNFDLLELAGGESGDAAVSAIVRKAKAKAARAKKAEAAAAAAEAAATGADKEKAALKNLYFQKLQHDNGIRSIEVELKRLREVLIKLRGEEKKLKDKGQDGIIKLRGEEKQLKDKRQDGLIKLRGEEKKLKDKGQDGRHIIQLSEEQRELRLKQLSEQQRELRQQQKKLREEQAKLRQQQKEFYLEHGFLAAEEEVPTQGESVQGTSDAGSEADEHKPAEEASTKANADANPSTGSEKSSTADEAVASKNGHDGSAFQKKKLNGSQKRKMRNAAKKNGGNEVDEAKKQDSSEADVSNKSSEDVSRTERKVSAEEFKGLQMLEKELDGEEAVMKAEKVQKKAKDAVKKEEKAQPKAKDANDAKPKKASLLRFVVCTLILTFTHLSVALISSRCSCE